MLAYDALVEQAKNRQMPPTKMRGILREYLQILILKEMARLSAGKKLYFTGGTYLRLGHNLKRFSEDLDFNIEAFSKKEFEGLVKTIALALKKYNIDAKVKFKYWENIYTAYLIFPFIEKAYNIASRYSKPSGIIIKIETNRPIWKIKKEVQVISGFGEIFSCVCTDKSALFADKVDALNKKQRGRHLYDIIFMLSNNYVIDKSVLTSLGIEGDPLVLIAKRTESFSQAQLKKQAEDLRPFLFEESQADLIINAHKIIPELLDKYKVRKNQ